MFIAQSSDLCSCSKKKKALTDSSEKLFIVSSIAPQEGGGQLWPLKQTHWDAHAEHLTEPFSCRYFS